MHLRNFLEISTYFDCMDRFGYMLTSQEVRRLQELALAVFQELLVSAANSLLATAKISCVKAK
jgi:hypothetical protein